MVGLTQSLPWGVGIKYVWLHFHEGIKMMRTRITIDESKVVGGGDGRTSRRRPGRTKRHLGQEEEQFVSLFIRLIPFSRIVTGGREKYMVLVYNPARCGGVFNIMCRVLFIKNLPVL
jgi:hypothetical protein